jgi:steroid delta-isomerase-like uncharacterized protein
VWEEIMAEDFHLHHPLVEAGVLEAGRTGYTKALGQLWEAFPDLEVELHRVVGEDDFVVIHYTERGTHLGDFMGVAPNGRSYEKHGFSMYRVSEGRLQECWLQEDDQSFQQQLFG